MTIDDFALFFAGEPDEYMETSLIAFGENVRKGWREQFAPVELIDGTVADVLERVRARKHEIEAEGAGRA